MEDVLKTILTIGLVICVSYIMGLAAHIWTEVKIFIIIVLGSIFVGLFLQSLVSEDQLSTGKAIQSILPYIIIFTPLGYVTGHSIIKHFGDRLETLMGSDEFDAMYRQHAKRHKTAFANDDKDAFSDFHKSYNANKKSNSGSFYDRSGRRSSGAYEDYSQYRRSHSKAERTAPPPQQDHRSDKDKMLDILEVSNKNASAKALKSAYRKLAWKYHPDVLAKDELSAAQLKAAEARMKDINQAYDWLKDNGFAD